MLKTTLAILIFCLPFTFTSIELNELLKARVEVSSF